jgi:transcriptional regulator with XRE-family HTH domain
MSSVAEPTPFGALLREWRDRRHLSQLELATGSAVSTRHLSFIEAGRARPSREMVLHLAERLQVPFRARNRLLVAAGFAPVYAERTLADDVMAPVREALDQFLAAHEPYPAIVLDRLRNVIATNRAVGVLTEGVAPELLEPPMNALRIALHPDGLASRIVNFSVWSRHLLSRVTREATSTGDPEMAALCAELAAYPNVGVTEDHAEIPTAADIVLPLRLSDPAGELSLFSTITVFGTAREVTLSEIAIEAFYPADAETAAALHDRAAANGSALPQR